MPDREFAITLSRPNGEGPQRLARNDGERNPLTDPADGPNPPEASSLARHAPAAEAADPTPATTASTESAAAAGAPTDTAAAAGPTAAATAAT